MLTNSAEFVRWQQTSSRTGITELSNILQRQTTEFLKLHYLEPDLAEFSISTENCDDPVQSWFYTVRVKNNQNEHGIYIIIPDCTFSSVVSTLIDSSSKVKLEQKTALSDYLMMTYVKSLHKVLSETSNSDYTCSAAEIPAGVTANDLRESGTTISFRYRCLSLNNIDVRLLVVVPFRTKLIDWLDQQEPDPRSLGDIVQDNRLLARTVKFDFKVVAKSVQSIEQIQEHRFLDLADAALFITT